MATDHGVAARFYLLVIVFCRSGIFLPWLLAHLQMPPSGQADSGTAPLSNSWKLSWEGQTPSCSLVQKDARGDKLTNLCQKVATRHPVACLGLRGLALPQHVGFL